MNEEIKEILENIKKCCNIMKDNNFVIYQKQDILILLDYITNLQEEVKESNENTEWWRNRFNAVERENKELNNIIDKLENYIKAHIEVCENRLTTPFCNFEKATKELMIHNNYLDKLQELKENNLCM